MSAAEIQVERVSLATLDGDVQGHFKVSDAEDGTLQIVGWAFSRYGYVSSIEIRAGESMVASTVPRIQRPDVQERFPAVDAAATSGFALAIEAQGAGRSNLEVIAVLTEGARHSLGQVDVLVDDR